MSRLTYKEAFLQIAKEMEEGPNSSRFICHNIRTLYVYGTISLDTMNKMISRVERYIRPFSNYERYIQVKATRRINNVSKEGEKAPFYRYARIQLCKFLANEDN